MNGRQIGAAQGNLVAERCRGQQLNADVVRHHITEGQNELGIVFPIQRSQTQYVVRARIWTHRRGARTEQEITGLMRTCQHRRHHRRQYHQSCLFHYPLHLCG